MSILDESGLFANGIAAQTSHDYLTKCRFWTALRSYETKYNRNLRLIHANTAESLEDQFKKGRQTPFIAEFNNGLLLNLIATEEEGNRHADFFKRIKNPDNTLNIKAILDDMAPTGMFEEGDDLTINMRFVYILSCRPMFDYTGSIYTRNINVAYIPALVRKKNGDSYVTHYTLYNDEENKEFTFFKDFDKVKDTLFAMSHGLFKRTNKI